MLSAMRRPHSAPDDQLGANLVEYVLLILLILLVAMVAIRAFNDNLSTQFSTITSNLQDVMN